VEEVEEGDEEIPACIACVWCIAVREQMTWHFLLWYMDSYGEQN
jgi:hypothetical protein